MDTLQKVLYDEGRGGHPVKKRLCRHKSDAGPSDILLDNSTDTCARAFPSRSGPLPAPLPATDGIGRLET